MSKRQVLLESYGVARKHGFSAMSAGAIAGLFLATDGRVANALATLDFVRAYLLQVQDEEWTAEPRVTPRPTLDKPVLLGVILDTSLPKETP